MELSGLFIYPVKSLGGISLNEALVENRGLQFDRRWMLVDETGRFLTQRELPKMATLKVSLESENLKITFGNDALLIPLQPMSNEKIKVQIWQSNCEARLYDETINAWFSDVLQKKCGLVQMPEETQRMVNPIYAI